jgi:ABC-type enterobactin transport system permease subunit
MATVSFSIGEQRVLGLPRETGLAIIFGAIAGGVVTAILSAFIAVRRRKRRQSLTVP